MRSNILSKIALIACFVSLTVSYVLSFINPINGYELSIYSSTPKFIWISIVFCFIVGILLVIEQVYCEKYTFSYLGISLLLLFLTRITLLYVPYIRGYYTWRGDNISHMGSVIDIFLSNHLPPTNFYPITHILISEIVYISGLPLNIVVNYSTALFSSFYVISIYLLSTSVLDSKKAQIISMATIIGVFFDAYNVFLMPNGWSILYIPFFFFLYFKYCSINNFSVQYSLLLVIILIFYPFFHPFSTTLIIILLLIIGVSKFFIYVFVLNNRLSYRLGTLIPFFQLNLILIVTTIFVPWILSFQAFKLNIKRFYNSVTSGTSPDVVANMGNTLEKLNLHGLDALEIILKIKGDDFLFLFYSLIAFIVLFKNSRERVKNLNLLVLLSMIFILGVFYSMYLFGLLPGLQNLATERLLSYLVVFTPIPAAFVLNYFISDRNKIFSTLCVIMIMTASIISIFSLYPSPIILRPTPEVTEMDISSTQWLINYSNPYVKTTTIMTPVFRFADGIIGTQNSKTIFEKYPPTIPDHFNYTMHDYFGDSYEDDRYALITKFDSIIYVTVWDAVGRFNSHDFEKLETDKTTEKLYSNGDSNVWYIHVSQ